MKNTSVLFYLPAICFCILFYGVIGFDEYPFWENNSTYIIITLITLALVIELYIKAKKLHERKVYKQSITVTIYGITIFLMLLSVIIS